MDPAGEMGFLIEDEDEGELDLRSLRLGQITWEKISNNVAGLGPVPALNGLEVAQLCYGAGWHDVKTLAAAIGTCASESLFHPQAFHHNVDANGNVISTDWGMWQLNDKAHPDFFPNGSTEDAFDPVKATGFAFEVWKDGGGSFDPWYGHLNEVYLDDYYLRRSWLAVANFGARLWVLEAEERPPVIAGRTTPPTKTRTTMITLAEFRTIYPPGT